MNMWKYKLLALFNPKYWIRTYDMDRDWDAALLDMLQNNPTIVVGYATALINGIEVWHENYPYASGRKVYNGDFGKTVCKRSTAILLQEMIVAALAKQNTTCALSPRDFQVRYGLTHPSYGG